jgi:hypothetical protein
MNPDIRRLERKLERTTNPAVRELIIADLEFLYEQEIEAAEPTDQALDEFALIGENRTFGGEFHA